MCCTLRDDLLKEVRKLTEDSRFDYLLIESIGISEPLPMAATFDFRDEHSESLSDVARLDTMVRVVDAANLLNEYASPISCASAESRSATTTTAPFVRLQCGLDRKSAYRARGDNEADSRTTTSDLAPSVPFRPSNRSSAIRIQFVRNGPGDTRRARA